MGGRAEGEGERVLSRDHPDHRVGHRAGSQYPKIMTWAKNQESDGIWLHHPCTPHHYSLQINFISN